MKCSNRAKRWGFAASAAAMLLAASARAADSAYFSFLGTFASQSGSYEDFFFTTPAGSSPMILRTLSYSGGTTASGETTAGGGIDSILNLYLASAPATPIATNDDRGGGSRDSLLAYNGAGNTLLNPLAAGDYKLHLTNYSTVAGDGHWFTEMINTAGSLTLTDWSGYNSGAGILTLGGSGNATAVVPVPAGKSLGIYTLNVNTRGRVSIIGGTLTVNEGITLSGGTLERTTGTLAWANGKTMTIKNGGVFYAGGSYTVPSGGTISVNGSGSRIDCTRLGVGKSGGSGDVIFDNGANQTLPAVDLPADGTGNSRGTLTVRGTSTITVGDLRLSGFTNSDIFGTVTVTGADTSLTQSGTSVLAIGIPGQAGSAKLEVLDEGAFTSGTGTVVVGMGAQIKVDGGIFTAKGPVVVSAYGQILALDALDVPWMSFDAGMTLEADSYLRFITSTPAAAMATRGISTIKQNSHFELGSAQWLLAGNAYVKQQALVQTSEQYPGKLRIIEGGSLHVEAGAQAQIGALRVENGSAYLDQPEASVIATTPSAVGTGGAGSLLLKNGGWARLTSLDVGPCVAGETGSGSVTVEEGGYLELANLRMGMLGGNGQTATITARSGGQAVQTGTASLTIGSNVPGSTAVARIRVENDGSFVTGAGLTTINRTGRIENYDRFVAKGSMTVNDGAIINSRGDYAEALLDVTGDLLLNSGAMVNIVGMPANKSELAIHGKTTVANGASLLLTNGNSRLTAYDELTVQQGGTFTAGGEVIVGKAMKVQNAAATATTLLDAGTVTADGAGARLVGTYAELQNGGSIKLINGGKIDYATLRVEGLGVNAESASVDILNGEALATDILLGTRGNAAHSHAINVTGTAAKLTQYSGGRLTLGSTSMAASALASLNLSGGGTFTQPAGATLTLNPTGAINIVDGYATLGVVELNGGAFNFTSGSVTCLLNQSIGTGKLLGSSLTLTPLRKLTIAGTSGGVLTIDPFASVTLDGGSLTVGSLAANGTFQFLRGDLTITGAGGLTIGTGGMLGSAVGLGAGKRLTVNAATTIASTGLLNVDEGNSTAAGGLTNNGEIRLSHPMSQLSGGTLVNKKLLLGEGRVGNALVNQGEVRVTGTERMVLEGDENTNAGRINLLGGTLEVTRTLLNDRSGQINGRGTLIVSHGLVHQGQMTLSGGFTDVFGEVTGVEGSKITVTGGATATFYDFALFERGAEVFVNAGSTAVFLGGVEGANFFSGGGAKVFQSGVSSIGLIATAGSTVVESGAEIAVECVREPAVTVNGVMSLDVGGAVSRIGSLELAGTATAPEGRLDVGNGSLIVQSTLSSRFADLQRLTAQIAAARNGGEKLWQADGIGTRFGDELTGLAILLNDRGDGTPIVTTFGDQAVDASSILIATTWAGDLTLDGRVDGMDYLRMDRGFLAGRSGYAGGDIDYSGRTDGDDYFLIDRAFLGQSSMSGPAGASPVPEPGAAAVLLMAGMLLMRRRV